MVREQSNDALVLADRSGVLTAMHEIGAQGVGRLYDVEPIAVEGGCFHAKLILASTAEDAHVLVGSGNLTFGGWGANLECIDHLHTSFAPEAIQDASRFLQRLAVSTRVHHGAGTALEERADQLLRLSKNKIGDGAVRLLHNMDQSIVEQLSEIADGLHGATSLCVASPFFDAAGIASLCDSLELSHAFVHVHPQGSVMEHGGTNWPSGKSEQAAHPVALEWLVREDERLLHAKLYEIVCKRGRIVLSGSSNATRAGLLDHGNVELNVARIERELLLGWRHEPTTAPVRFTLQNETSAEAEVRPLILRATLKGTLIQGVILEQAPAGEVSIAVKVGLQWRIIGTTEVSPNRTFTAEFVDGWQLHRQVQLRVVFRPDLYAQGFLSLPEEREITRRLGPAARHFLSVLERRETPADIRAILEFLHDRPEWLGSATPVSGSKSVKKEADIETTVDVSGYLVPSLIPSTAHTGSTGLSGADRLMAQVFAAFREPRGPIETIAPSGDDAEDAAPWTEQHATAVAAEVDCAFASFDRLLDMLLSDFADTDRVIKAAALTQYVCDRLDADAQTTFLYLDRIVQAFRIASPTSEDRSFVASLVLLWAARLRPKEPAIAKYVRRILLRIELDLSKDHFALSDTDAFYKRLGITEHQLETLWFEVYRTRIVQEEILEYWTDVDFLRDANRYPLLSRLEVWADIAAGANPNIFRMKTYQEVCPHCHLALPSVSANRLRSQGATTCRGVVLLCEEL